MTIVKTLGIFIAAVIGELGGAYAVWRWRRLGGGSWLIAVGLGALFAYALVQTLQPETRFGRLFAAYAVIFMLGAMLWGWAFDGARPDRFDVLGAGVVLVGAGIILWGRDVLG